MPRSISTTMWFTEVLAEGYSDEADQVFVPKLREVVERLDVERGNPGPREHMVGGVEHGR